MPASESASLSGPTHPASLERRKWLIRVLLAGFSSPTLGGSTQPVTTANQTEPVEHALRSLALHWNLPSAQVAWRTSGCCLSDVEHVVFRRDADTVPMSSSVAYPVASVGKLMLGLIARNLLEERAIDLDTTVAYWLAEPWSTLVERNTTWRQLARHQAGLPEPISDSSFQTAVAAAPDRRWAADDLAAVVSRLSGASKRDRRFAYSNLHSVVLAHAIEGLAGQPLERLALPQLRTPFSSLAADWQQPASLAWRETGLLAWRHARKGRPIGYGRVLTDVTAYNPSWSGVGGDWSATINGLLRLGGLLGQVGAVWLNEPTEWVPNAPRRGESYGWHVMRRGAWIGHTGDVPGFSSALWVRPNDGALVAAMVPLSNTSDGQQPADALARVCMHAMSHA